MDDLIKYNDCIVFLLAKANQKSQRNLKKRLKKFGLTTVQGLILGELYMDDGMTASELGARLVLDNATVSGVLDRLLERGWIVKKSDEKDRRVQKIYLASRKDTELIRALSGARRDANEETLKNLSHEERILMKRLLKDIF